jgi:hypothetical protein
MRDAAVREQVLDRPDEADDEVEIGRGAGEEARGDASRQRARRRVLRRGGLCEQRSGERVGQRVQTLRGIAAQPLLRRFQAGEVAHHDAVVAAEQVDEVIGVLRVRRLVHQGDALLRGESDLGQIGD